MDILKSPLEVPVELKIILLCCGDLELNQDQLSHLRELLSLDVDWANLLETARYHRLVLLLARELNNHREQVPGWVMETLGKERRLIAQANLRQVKELNSISKALAASDIPLILLKGLSSTHLFFNGDVGLRQSSDIDLLIKPADFPAVAEVLFELGFDLNFDSKIPARELVKRKQFQSVQELTFFKKELKIDLHCQLAHFAALPIDPDDLWNCSQEHTIYGAKVRLLAEELLFIYLCVHGSRHNWRRLHWLNDIHYMLKNNELNWSIVVAEAEKLGVMPCVGVAFRVANLVFGTPVPYHLKARNQVWRNACRLSSNILPDILSCPPKKFTTHGIRAQFSYWLWCIRLQTKPVNKWKTIYSSFQPSDKDLATMQLPDRLSWMYVFVRIVRAGKLLLSKYVS
ncbi:MAG: nucleotidyltransferase family protein [Pseudomonadales bacterium]|nr:nucleotidyltransferase family protein [Pseudomonadales bacterium]